jgi:hypothetical protein
MTDERLGRLFAEGTAPERDAAFAALVDAEIGRARLVRRLLVIAMRALAVLTLASAAFLTARTIEPLLGSIAESSPRFMGVPVPLVAIALMAGLFAYARRFIRVRLG